MTSHRAMDNHGSCQLILDELEKVVLVFTQEFLSTSHVTGERQSSPFRLVLLPSGKYTAVCALRVAYLASVAHSVVAAKRLLTKRDVYYMCRLLFPSPVAVDRALEGLSKCVEVHRNDLNIVAAPKGLVVGDVSYEDENGCMVNVGMFGKEGCLIPSRPERMRDVKLDARTVVVVEKEAVFHSLLNDWSSREFLGSCLLVTGKGYPDYATRNFLRAISRAQTCGSVKVPIYVLTDADPHGLCIAKCYITSLLECNIKWLGVKPSDNGRYFRIEQTSLLALKPRETALLRSIEQECSDRRRREDNRFVSILTEARFLQKTGVKFEMEALSVISNSSGLPGLLEYLLKNVCEDAESTGLAFRGAT